MSTTKNLSQRERHLVNLQLESMRTEILKNRPTITQVATAISEKLAIRVGYSAIVTACEAIDLRWPKGHHSYPEKNRSDRENGAVYKKLKSIEEEVSWLKAVVSKLCSELGVQLT